MAKVNQQNVSQTNRRIALIRSMFERARRRWKLVESVLHSVVRRRMQLIQAAIILVLLAVAGKNAVVPICCSCRRLARYTGWWSIIWQTYSNARFRKTFRVSRGTFTFILSRIRHVLKRESVVEEPIPPDLRLAICLYRLGRGSYYYTIAEMSGLGVSTVCTITREVCQSIVNFLWEESVDKFMSHSEQDIRNKMRLKVPMKGKVGVIMMVKVSTASDCVGFDP